ncbi:hypothetical protein [Enterococcus italicus]|jgi:hypothetical protein|uniref:hypothetical protein n=1 Tax=Enterococcus italicus TaxID=246144 RepID=UPI0020749C86|nr:hypothetical protein [Enterococcus italicus]
MKTKSFIASILLCSSLLGVLGFSTLATNTVSASEVPKIEIATEELDLNSDQVTISVNMTRDEVIQSISNEFGISKEQAEQSIFSNSSQMRR